MMKDYNVNELLKSSISEIVEIKRIVQNSAIQDPAVKSVLVAIGEQIYNALNHIEEAINLINK